MKRVLAIVGLLALVASTAVAAGSRSKSTWTGWVSDAKCGAKVDAACAKKCIDAGEKPVFVSDKDKSVLNVANPDALKGHAGHHVQITGTVDNGTLTVDQVSMMK